MGRCNSANLSQGPRAYRQIDIIPFPVENIIECHSAEQQTFNYLPESVGTGIIGYWLVLTDLTDMSSGESTFVLFHTSTNLLHSRVY